MAPKQKPHRSKQDYRTPVEFLSAVERAFHVSTWTRDMAADADTTIRQVDYPGTPAPWYGPGGIFEDSLQVDWPDSGDLWLNPPFAHIEPWVEKCATAIRVGRIFLLVPASVGSNWYHAHVHGRAHVIALSPRLTFVGETHPYPKDLILAVYGPARGGFSTWRWKP